MPRARRVEVTEDGQHCGQYGYATAFEVVTGVDTLSPEQWARATFERAPKTLRWFVLFGWITSYDFGSGLGHPTPMFLDGGF